MTELVDPESGEVVDQSGLELVPLDIAALDEAALLEMFPTPVQVTGALLIARGRIATAPKVLARLSRELKAAKRTYIVARGFAVKRAQGASVEERRRIAEADSEVVTAGEAVDDAELALEYGREIRKTLTEDIDILRSLNANFRTEHRS